MESFALIIFGITSNLAQIKLIPALYDMEEKDLLPGNTHIIGIARKPRSQAEIQAYVQQVLQKENRHHRHVINPDVAARLIARFHYVAGEVADAELYSKLASSLDHCSLEMGGCHNRIFYLATYPDLYHAIFKHLQQAALNKQGTGWVRLMIEKPIGNDLTSAQVLNRLIGQYFSEDQVYRLDHYLGKETLQNILTFRFANDFVEPLLNKTFIDHIQVTTAEDFGIGARGGYFDAVGALKDVGQNHLLQMIAFATMNAPKSFDAHGVTKERLNILRHLKPYPSSLVLGQYEGYTEEPNVNPHSTQDTYFAFKTELNTDRFRGVPIYVRAGKFLAQDADEITVIFKPTPNPLMPTLQTSQFNALVFRLEPNEAIVFKIMTKKPGHKLELEPAYMQYCYRESARDLPDPYEKLMANAIAGDQTFFNDASEVEAQWAFIDAIEAEKQRPILYPKGSWGPKQADQMIAKDGRAWLEPSMAFCKISIPRAYSRGL